MKKWVALILRLFLGGIFIYASLDKIAHPAPFAEAVYNYQILPDGLINITAIALPWLELFLGLCLFFGIWVPGAVLTANLLLLVFFAALAFNAYRGLNIHCGCFSTSAVGAETASMTQTLIRDGSFLLTGVLLFWLTCIDDARNRPSLKLSDLNS